MKFLAIITLTLQLTNATLTGQCHCITTGTGISAMSLNRNLKTVVLWQLAIMVGDVVFTYIFTMDNTALAKYHLGHVHTSAGFLDVRL